MLALFRNNQSTTALLLAAYVILLHLPATQGWVEPPAAGAATGGGILFQDLFGWIAATPRSSALAATILVLLQAFLVNSLADGFRLMEDRSWYPGVLYAAAVSSLPDFQYASPALVAVTFLPIALRRIFSVYKQTQAYSPIFDAAFWICLATIFHPSAVWCLPAAYFALFNLRSFNPREQLVFFTGIFAPFFLALTGYFWYDRGGEFLQVQFTQWIAFPTFVFPSGYAGMKTGLLVLLLLVGLLGFNVYYHKKLIQVQKYITIFYWFMLAGLVSMLCHPEMRLEFALLTMPSLGIFLAYLFQSIRNGLIAELLHLVLLAAIFLLQFYPK